MMIIRYHPSVDGEMFVKSVYGPMCKYVDDCALVFESMISR